MTLIERLESLTGPCRDLDRDIGCDLAGKPRNDPVPLHYTANIDAAMTLVPGGFEDVQVNRSGMAFLVTSRGGIQHSGFGQGAAIALCIAALKARGFE